MKSIIQSHSTHRHSRSASLLMEMANELSRAHRFVKRPARSMLYDEEELAVLMWTKKKYHVPDQLKRMKAQQLINYKKIGEKYKIALTDKGLIEAVREQVMSADLFSDDRVCMVVFDIPETQRAIRKLLRDFLTRAAFIPLQRSVWISPFDAGNQLAKLFAITGSTKWVRIYTAKRHDDKSSTTK